MCTPMFIADLFTVAKDGSNPNLHLQMNGPTKWSLLSAESYSVLKRKAIFTQAAAWVNYEGIMLGEEASHKRTNT